MALRLTADWGWRRRDRCPFSARGSHHRRLKTMWRRRRYALVIRVSMRSIKWFYGGVRHANATRRLCRNCVSWAQSDRRTPTFTASHRGVSCSGKLLNRLRNEVFRYHLVLLAGFAFQACSIDHSDISPFRINNLQSRTGRDQSDCDKSSNVPRSLTGFSSIAAALLLPQRNDRRASILLNRNVETASKSACVTVC
jgi:hypothetical protein